MPVVLSDTDKVTVHAVVDGGVVSIQDSVRAGAVVRLGVLVHATTGPHTDVARFHFKRIATIDCVASKLRTDEANDMAPAKTEDGARLLLGHSIRIGQGGQVAQWCGHCLLVGFEVTDLATGARGVTSVGLQLTYPDYQPAPP